MVAVNAVARRNAPGTVNAMANGTDDVTAPSQTPTQTAAMHKEIKRRAAAKKPDVRREIAPPAQRINRVTPARRSRRMAQALAVRAPQATADTPQAQPVRMRTMPIAVSHAHRVKPMATCPPMPRATAHYCRAAHAVIVPDRLDVLCAETIRLGAPGPVPHCR